MTDGGYSHVNESREWEMPFFMNPSDVEDKRQPRQSQSESDKADDQRTPQNRLQGMDLFRQFLDEFELLGQRLFHFRNASLERSFLRLSFCLLILERRNG